MSIVYTSEQESLRSLVRDFMEKEVMPHAEENDRAGRFPTEIFKKSAELGFHLMCVQEKYGGMGFDEQTICVALEEMGRGEAGFADTIMTTNSAVNLLNWAGTEDQIKWGMDYIVPGGFGSFGLTEPNAGSDSAALTTSAVRKGDKYILNGRKCFITNAGISDVFIVLATVDRSLGHKGITAFLVDRETPGFSVGKSEDLMGIRTVNVGDLIFEDAEVPAWRRLGNEGEGFKIAMKNLDSARIHNATVATGISQRALEEAVRYAKERQQFGKPIGQHEGLKFLLADMAMNVEAGRMLYWNAAGMIDRGLRPSKEACMAKCFCSDTAMRVTTDAVQIFGGYGYSREYPVEKLMRDAKIFQIFDGTNQIQRMIIGNQLLR